MSTTRSITAPSSVAAAALAEQQDRTIDKAISILKERVFQRGASLCTPNDVRRFLELRLIAEKREIFAVIFLDAGRQPIAFEILSTGTLTHASVYPREVLERVLFHNAEAIIMAHNNPSGRCEPSEEDRRVTARLHETLALLDARVVDHIVVGKDTAYSFAEHGIL